MNITNGRKQALTVTWAISPLSHAQLITLASVGMQKWPNPPPFRLHSIWRISVSLSRVVCWGLSQLFKNQNFSDQDSSMWTRQGYRIFHDDLTMDYSSVISHITLSQGQSVVHGEHVLMPFENSLHLICCGIFSWAIDAWSMEIRTLKLFRKVTKCISGKFERFDLESSSASKELYDFEQIITSVFYLYAGHCISLQGGQKAVISWWQNI